MTRNNLYIILNVFFAVGFSSCNNDLLDTIPNDRISENVFWKTPQDALLAVNSLYNDLEGTSLFFYDALTEIGHVNFVNDAFAFVERGNYDTQNANVYNEWRKAYRGIGAVNYFLANVDKIAFEDDKTLKRYKGEARVLRAYQYIKLVTLFGDVPLIEAPLSLEASRIITRNNTTEIWNFIDKELEEVNSWLPDSYDAKDKGRITKWAALGLKARAALYAGNYSVAANAANQIINSGLFKLYPNYGKLFLYEAENNSEILLDRQYIKDVNSNNVFYLLAPYSQKNSESSYVPTKVLADLYQTAEGKDISDSDSGYNPNEPYKNRDPRLNFSLFLDGDPLPNGGTFHPAPNSGTSDAVGSTYHASATGFNVKKYVNTEDYASPSNTGINIILLRYAEILLTYAEAKIELHEGNEPAVYTAINLIRNGRSDVKLAAIESGKTEEELRAIVRRERTVELAFEGLHLIDIRRWKTAEHVLPGNIYGITYVDNDSSVKIVQAVSPSRIFNRERDYLWPIPQNERDLNPNLTQNNNW